jgi:hypothetical protein
MATAHALAVSEAKPLSRAYLELAIDLNDEFQTDYNGAGPIANKQAYN